jgi:glutamine amidotransferase
MAIGIIDYGMGNLKSVSNAIQFLGGECFISNDYDALCQADQLILPGVGAFKDAIELIREKKFDTLLKEAQEQGKPILGICLGMQLMFDSSDEFGHHQGLGLLPGKIIKLNVPLKIPHMGWNRLDIQKTAPLFKNLPEEAYVYFVHSYYLETHVDIVSATTYYGKEIQIAAQQGNTYALQFHPEKSGSVGLQILKNFMSL